MPKELSYLEAIREALVEEMRRDSKVFVLGEDVGAYGGAFGVTQGLYDEFGEMRGHRHADLRVGDHRREHRRGAARLSPGGGDAVRRLHLVRLRPDRQSGGDAALSLRRPRLGADRGPCAERRQRRRRAVSLTESRSLVHPPPRPESRRPVDPVRRQGAAQGRDSRQRSGGLLRAQVSLSPRQGSGAGGRRDRADRRGRDPARGRRHHAADLRGDGRCRRSRPPIDWPRKASRSR